MNWLDPKQDVVFKLLFANEKNRNILVALLTAVLKPTAPIGSVEVLNPEIPKDLPADKGIVLDIHVRLSDGRHVNVEMQSEAHAGFVQRVLYYWARLHSLQLLRGDYYETLCPTLSVVITNEPLLPLAKAHSKFTVSEADTKHPLSDELEIHFVELPKIDLEPDDSALKTWMRFLLAKDENELEKLAMSNPDIRSATEALKVLSQDPAAQELARQREMAQINLKIMHQYAVAEGEAKGRAEGEAKGRAEGEAKGRTEGEIRALRHEVQTVAGLLDIEFNETRKTQVEAMGADQLKRLVDALVNERRWPGT